MPKERRTVVQPVRVELICDCGGYMKQNNRVLMTSPPLYEYTCQGCEQKHTMRKSYPRIEYAEVQSD